MKNKIIFIIIILLVFMILLIPLKGSYAFYSDNKDLEIINTKIGNFKETTIERLIRTSSLNTPKNDTTLEPLSDVTEREDTLRRYQGSAEEVTNNYICFGTTEKDKCTKDTDHYMYRIIGYDTVSGELKVIKKEALNKSYSWWSDYEANITWPNSLPYQAINGDDFLNNENYIPTNDKGVNWQDKIIAHKYLYGDMRDSTIYGTSQVGSELFKVESGKKETVWYDKALKDTPGVLKTVADDRTSPYYEKTIYYLDQKGLWNETKISKISLMYLSDYYLSINSEAICDQNHNSYDICKLGWIHITQNDSTASSKEEWNISRCGDNSWSGLYVANVIYESGAVHNLYTHRAHSLRPAFYLSNNIQIIGDGTSENPFVIIN